MCSGTCAQLSQPGLPSDFSARISEAMQITISFKIHMNELRRQTLRI